MVAVEVIFFRKKEIPKHILALLLFSSPILTAMASVIIVTVIDHREHIILFGQLKRYLASNRKSTFFFSLPPCILCILCILALLGTAFFSLISDYTPWHF